METVHVSLGDRSYDISVAKGLFTSGKAVELLAPFARGVKVLIVSDSNVFPLCGETLRRALLDAGPCLTPEPPTSPSPFSRPARPANTSA